MVNEIDNTQRQHNNKIVQMDNNKLLLNKVYLCQFYQIKD